MKNYLIMNESLFNFYIINGDGFLEAICNAVLENPIYFGFDFYEVDWSNNKIINDNVLKNDEISNMLKNQTNLLLYYASSLIKLMIEKNFDFYELIIDNRRIDYKKIN